MSVVLTTVIVVPLVMENGPVHKKYQKHIVSVMTEEKQRLLILRARQSCYKLAVVRQQEFNNATHQPAICQVAWDGLLCWDLTRSGTVAKQRCPDYVNAFNTNGVVTRSCIENGTWWINPDPGVNNTWTNFSECVRPAIDLTFHTAHGVKLRLMYTIGYSFSMGALLVAVIIMLCCRQLHSKSNTLHVNLFLAFIFRAAVSLLKDILFVGNVGLAKDVRRDKDGILEFAHDDTHWECKLLIVVFMYCVSACNMWIFAEALYLTMLVSRPLATERGGVRMYIILGWSLSLAFIVPWVIVKALYENTFCWNIHHNTSYYWILRGSGVAVVMINFFLFLNIFRKLFHKLRHSSQRGVCGKAKYRRLAKFILVLIPLFGIMYIVFYVAVPSNFEEVGFNVAYLYLEMGYNSFQGFLLALLFCFLNEQVHGELKRLWKRHRSRRHELSIIRSYYCHSPSHKNHSTISKHDAHVHSHAVIAQSDSAVHKQLHQLDTLSVSSDKSFDLASETNMDVIRPKCSRNIPSKDKNATVTAACPTINNVFSHFTDLEYSDSLLKQAIWIDRQHSFKRQNTTKSTGSQPLANTLGWQTERLYCGGSSKGDISNL